MRQIILDTETTGIGHEQGHRVIEIGCVEIVDRKLTGMHYHVYINPQRPIDEGAFRVHGISIEFLQDKPVYADIHAEFLQFIEGAELIIHNAPFDVGFLNAEFRHAQWPKKIEDHCAIIDTLTLARDKHPGQRNSLDALCKRYDIDNSNRQLHGALLDAEILAYVYLAMTGGQGNLFSAVEHQITQHSELGKQGKSLKLANAIIIKANNEELAAHELFIKFLEKKSGIDYWRESKD